MRPSRLKSDSWMRREIGSAMVKMDQGERRPLDLWDGTLIDHDGITEVMMQNSAQEGVNMDDLDEIGNNEGLDMIITMLTVDALEDATDNTVFWCF